VDACRYFAALSVRALDGASKDELLATHAAPIESASLAPTIQALARGDYSEKAADEIRGTGYVVQSLEAALWCFWQTSSFEEAILTAVNLGDDADTTGAICGQIAGAHYGEDGIPASWIKRLAMREQIEDLGDRLHRARPASG